MDKSETELWPRSGMHVTFLTEGPHTPLPPPGVAQESFRFPAGTRVVRVCSPMEGFLIAHDELEARFVGVNGIVIEGPFAGAEGLISGRANTMDGSPVLRFGIRAEGGNGGHIDEGNSNAM